MNADELAGEYPEFDIIKMDGFDDCVMGVLWPEDNIGPILVYDRALVLKELMNQGMDAEEAQEFHEFNQVGAYMGTGTPVFMDIPEKYNPDTRAWQQILADQEKE